MGELKTLDKVVVDDSGEVHIVWPHRWEHDKNPESFFQVLHRMHEEGLKFKVSVLGEMYSEVPPVFAEAKEILCDHIAQFGYAESKDDYYRVLRQADVVVSTAQHEFFGVSMLEASFLGCFPLVPNRLVYPEISPDQCIYNTDNQLYKKLKKFSLYPKAARKAEISIDYEKF